MQGNLRGGAAPGNGRAAREPHRVARMPGHESWMAVLRDGEGNLVGLMEERRG